MTEPRPPEDARRPFRIVVDVLATAEQVERLRAAVGEAMCDAPGDHPGPCRIAWSTASYGLDDEEADVIREQLAPVAVWPRADVDRSLGVGR